jgi:hypothetical protein
MFSSPASRQTILKEYNKKIVALWQQLLPSRQRLVWFVYNGRNFLYIILLEVDNPWFGIIVDDGFFLVPKDGLYLIVIGKVCYEISILARALITCSLDSCWFKRCTASNFWTTVGGSHTVDERADVLDIRYAVSVSICVCLCSSKSRIRVSDSVPIQIKLILIGSEWCIIY